MKQMPFAEFANIVATAINREATSLAQWRGLYRTTEPARGVRIILEEDKQQTVSEIPAELLAHQVVSWLRLQTISVTLRKAREIVEMWVAISEPLEFDSIRPVVWRNEIAYSWQRLPWDFPETGGDTPTWDLLLSRCSNSRAFKAWIGSLFFDKSYLQQYVWCYGVGNNGKGCINRFLSKVFGRAYASKQPPRFGDKFWTYGLLGKRLVVFPDCNDSVFVTSGLFKSMSGGDPIDVEKKHGMAHTVRLSAKYLFFSNERPMLSSEAADNRRIIYCEFTQREEEENDHAFEHKLWEQGGRFLYDCLHAYMEEAPNHLPIKSDRYEISDWIDTVEVEFAEALDYHFEIHDPTLKLDWVRPIVLQRHLESSFKSRRKQLEFIAWLERRHGIKKLTDHNQTGDPKVYRGLIPKQLCLVTDARTGKTTAGKSFPSQDR